MKAPLWLHGTTDSRASSNFHSQLKGYAFSTYGFEILKMHPFWRIFFTQRHLLLVFKEQELRDWENGYVRIWTKAAQAWRAGLRRLHSRVLETLGTQSWSPCKPAWWEKLAKKCCAMLHFCWGKAIGRSLWRRNHGHWKPELGRSVGLTCNPVALSRPSWECW